MLIGTALVCRAAAESPREPGPAPLLALWEHAAGISLEAAAPQLVIYQDGTVLARARPDTAGVGQFVTKQLPLAEVNIWYDDIFAVARDEDLKGRYELGGRAADRAATFYFQAGAHGLLVTVSGLAEGALTPFGAPLVPPAEEVPARLLRIYQDVRRMKLDGTRPWAPEWIEARIRPVAADAGSARQWPAAWPKVPPTFTAGRSDGVVAIRGAEFLGAREFRESAATWQAARLDGAIAQVAFRPVLPGEAVWRRHIAADVDASRAALSAAARSELGAEREQMRTAMQERVGTQAAADIGLQPAIPPPPPFSPTLDRPMPKISPVPPSPDPPLPKSKKTR